MPSNLALFRPKIYNQVPGDCDIVRFRVKKRSPRLPDALRRRWAFGFFTSMRTSPLAAPPQQTVGQPGELLLLRHQRRRERPTL